MGGGVTLRGGLYGAGCRKVQCCLRKQMASMASTQLDEVWGVSRSGWGGGGAGCRAEGAVLPVKADGIHSVDVSVGVAVALSAYVSIRQHTSAYGIYSVDVSVGVAVALSK